MGDDWIDRLAAGGKYTGLGLVAYTGFRLFVFGCNFFAGRYDTRQDRLEQREKRLEASLGKRLDHLEDADRDNQGRIRLLEECVALLATELRMADPGNSKLGDVARMLRGVIPLAATDPSLDEIMQHARRPGETQ